MRELTLGSLAELIGGELHGSPACRIRSVAPLEDAGPGDLSFVANARYLSYVGHTRAAALLVARDLAAEVVTEIPFIVVDRPHHALTRVLEHLAPADETAPGVHPSAIIHPEAELGAGVSIGPFTVIARGTRVGTGTRIGAHTTVGAHCRIGPDCVLHSQVTLGAGVILGERCILHPGSRVGTEGFGYVREEGGHRTIPHLGSCRLGDDVEVGANSTIDRGSVGDTVIGSGTKIDNLVQIGHNARIGERVMIVSQVGISGSCRIGDDAVLGGQAGVGGHISIGAGAQIAARAGVIGDIRAGETVSGYPARPHREALRASAALFRFPELQRRIRELERRLSGLPDASEIPVHPNEPKRADTG